MSVQDVSHTRAFSTERAVQPIRAAEDVRASLHAQDSAAGLASCIDAQISGTHLRPNGGGLKDDSANAGLIEVDLGEKGDDVEKALCDLLQPDAPPPNDTKRMISAAGAYLIIWVISFTSWGLFSWHFVHACFWPVPAVGLGLSNNTFAASIGVILALAIVLLVTIGYSTYRLVPSIFPRLRQLHASNVARRQCTGLTPVIAALCVSALIATSLYLAFVAGTLAQPYSTACDANMPVTAFISITKEGTSGIVELYETAGGSAWSASGHIGQTLGELQFVANTTTVNGSAIGQISSGSNIPAGDYDAQLSTFSVPDADTSPSFNSYTLGWAGDWPVFTISSQINPEMVFIRGAAIAPSSCRTLKICTREVEDRAMVELLKRVFFAQSQYVRNGCR